MVEPPAATPPVADGRWETPRQAARRELLEETGLEAELLAQPAAVSFLGIMSHPVQGWIVNSFGHAVGSRNFDTPDNSRNDHVGAWLIWGEGLQNNHHAYPGSAKFSYHWWEADFGWLVARTLERVGAVRVNRAGLIPRPVTDHIIPEADRHHLADGCPAQARHLPSYSAGRSRRRRRQPSAR